MKICIIAAISLDGKIGADTGDNVSWTGPEDKKLFATATTQAGVIIMGNNTFKTLAKPLENRLTIVLTTTPESFSPVSGLVEFSKDSPAAIIANLERRGFTQVFITGGSQIYALFMKAGLIDELWLTLSPLIIGKGIPLFGSDIPFYNAHLLESRSLAPDTLFLRYAITTEGRRSDTR
jgi:dihydrofolate reductase